MHKKSKQSAKGAEYESQGQVPSNARHVAPGCDMHERIRPERPKISRVLRAFSAGPDCLSLTRGDALRSASRLPLAFIFRAFGAPFPLFVQSLQSAMYVWSISDRKVCRSPSVVASTTGPSTMPSSPKTLIPPSTEKKTKSSCSLVRFLTNFGRRKLSIVLTTNAPQTSSNTALVQCPVVIR